jgi:hypothetical protein
MIPTLAPESVKGSPVNPFFSLSDSKFNRYHREEVDMILSGIACALNSEAVYCSSELTSGFRSFEALRKHGLKSVPELKKQAVNTSYKTNVTDLNINSANEFAASVRYRLNDNSTVITPAPFEAPEWSQTEYLAFWERLIRTRVKAVWFNRNWQFSNGCTFEFAVAVDADVPTFDWNGNGLDQRIGIKSVEMAVQQLGAEGFDTIKLQENLSRLHALSVVSFVRGLGQRRSVPRNGREDLRRFASTLAQLSSRALTLDVSHGNGRAHRSKNNGSRQ